MRVSVRLPVQRGEARPGPRERPAHAALGVEHDELVCARGRDEEAVWRPRGVPVVAEQPLRAVAVHQPGAASARDQQLSWRRQREERRLGPLDPDRLAQRADDRAPGWAQRRGDHGADDGRRDERPRMAAWPGDGLALGVGPAHDRPGALLGLVLSRSPEPHSSRSFSESSPRRRRELTVPRGSSSSSAISPGV